MISFVKGKVADISENSLVVENGGIGYEIYMTGQDLRKARVGEEKKINTFLYEEKIFFSYTDFFQRMILGCSGFFWE